MNLFFLRGGGGRQAGTDDFVKTGSVYPSGAIYSFPFFGDICEATCFDNSWDGEL